MLSWSCSVPIASPTSFVSAFLSKISLATANATCRKSVETARFLSEYYSSIQDKIPGEEETISMPAPDLSEDKVREGIDLLSSWLRQQRERYFPSGVPLPEQPKTLRDATSLNPCWIGCGWWNSTDDACPIRLFTRKRKRFWQTCPISPTWRL